MSIIFLRSFFFGRFIGIFLGSGIVLFGLKRRKLGFGERVGRGVLCRGSRRVRAGIYRLNYSFFKLGLWFV